MDLLRFRAVRALVRWWGFPYVFQLVMLGILVSVAIAAWGSFAPQGVPTKLYAKTNLPHLLIWGLWWPAMLWTAVLFGRAWCMVCPLELVATATERLGRRLGIPQLRLGKLLGAGFLVLALYGLIQMLIAGLHFHRTPAYTSIFLVVLLGFAAAVGLLYKDRAFCRGYCPVALMLGTYGRGGMLAVRHGASGECEACTSRDCVLACNRDRWQARSCPSMLSPAKLNSNRDCLVCGQCIKACEPDNMQLLLRRPFPAADARERLASWAVVLFVMLDSGFVSYETTGEWTAAKEVFLWVPHTVASGLGLEAGNGWVKGVWSLIVFPALLWTALGTLVKASGGAKTVREAWRRLALPAVVVFASLHLANGLGKIASWGGFLPVSLQDPTGTDAVLALRAGTVSVPGPLLSTTWVSIIGVALVLVATGFAIREARLANPAVAGRLVVPLVLIAAAGIYVVVGWSFA